MELLKEFFVYKCYVKLLKENKSGRFVAESEGELHEDY